MVAQGDLLVLYSPPPMAAQKEPVPIRPGMHYQMGGIKTDVDGRCWDMHGVWPGVPGMFAAGETACLSLHGGNRLGANSLLDTVVFGRRAGLCAAEYVREVPTPHVPDSAVGMEQQAVSALLSRHANTDSIATIRREMGVAMHTHLGVFRDQEGIMTAKGTLEALRDRYSRVSVQDKGRVFNTSLIRALELGFMLDCAETIVCSALLRRESRGAHFRTDYLHRDDEQWLKHILVYHQPDGSSRVEYLPVRLTRWEPKVRIY